MERNELKGKQTKGVWKVQEHDTYDKSFMVGPVLIDNDDVDEVEAEANGALVAEAGTVANRTGMWPEDMVAALATCFRQSGADPDGNEDWRIAGRAVAEVTRLRAEYDQQAGQILDMEKRIKDLMKIRAIHKAKFDSGELMVVKKASLVPDGSIMVCSNCKKPVLFFGHRHADGDFHTCGAKLVAPRKA